MKNKLNSIKYDLFILSGGEKILKNMSKSFRSKIKTAKIIVFNDDVQQLNNLKNILSKKYKNIEVYNSAGHLENIAFSTRKKLIKLIASAKNIKINSNKLKNYLVYDKKFSFWWLNEIYHKRSYKFKTFTYLCHLDFISNTITNWEDISEVIILSKDQPLIAVFNNFFREYSVKTFPHQKSYLYQIKKSFFFQFFYNLLAFFKWFTKYLFITLMCKLYLSKNSKINKITFIQFYTAIWPKSEEYRDDKFGKNNEIISSFNNDEAITACSIFPDEFHPSVDLSTFQKILKDRHKFKSKSNNIFIMELYISIRKIFYLFFYSIYLIYKLSILSNYKSFNNYWIYEGTDISPFIKTELERSILRIPRLIFYTERLKYFVRTFKPKAIIYNMYEAPIGKATLFALKEDNTSYITIATQDGPHSRLKLETANDPLEFKKLNTQNNYIDYMPLPDQIILEGSYAKNILIESGYPPNKLSVCGSARMIGLNKLKIKKVRISKNIIFVPFSVNDHYQLINFCKELSLINKSVNFVFKNHPRTSINDNEVKQILHEVDFDLNRFIVSEKSSWKLFNETSIVLGTFTSVLDEAAIKGMRVICIYLNGKINNSPLIDLNPRWVQFAKNPSDAARLITEKYNYPSDEELLKLEKHVYNDTAKDTVHNWNKKIREIVK